MIKVTGRKKLSFDRRMRACYNALKICIKEQYAYQVSALTFSTLLAIVPLIAVSIYIAALMPLLNNVIQNLKLYIYTNFIPEAGNVVQHYLEQFVSHAVKLPLGGLIFLFITVGMLMLLVKNSMNDIWHSPKHSTWLSSIINWIALVCLPLLIGLSIFSSYYLLTLSWITYTINYLGIAFAISILIPLLINTIAFSMLYYVAPNCHVWFVDSLFGGMVAAVLFEIARMIFEYYIRAFANYDLIYGSLAIIPTFMIWVYISWSIIIFGSVVTYAQNQQRIIP
jgi:membrane protein